MRFVHPVAKKTPISFPRKISGSSSSVAVPAMRDLRFSRAALVTARSSFNRRI